MADYSIWVRNQNGTPLRRCEVVHSCPPEECEAAMEQEGYAPDQRDSFLHYTDSRGHCALSLPPRADGRLLRFTVRAPGYGAQERPPGISNVFELTALPILGEMPLAWRPQWHAFRLADQRFRQAEDEDERRQWEPRRERMREELLRVLEENGIADPESYIDDVCERVRVTTSNEVIREARPLNDGFD